MDSQKSINTIADWLDRTKGNPKGDPEFRAHLAEVVLVADEAVKQRELNLELQNQNDFLRTLVSQIFESMFGAKHKREIESLWLAISGLREVVGRIDEEQNGTPHS